MTAKVISERNGYGFGFDWSLSVSTKKNPQKTFLLGQDVKYCMRMLSSDLQEVINECNLKSGLSSEDPEGYQKLGDFIVNDLQLTEDELDNTEVWDLSCQ